MIVVMDWNAHKVYKWQGNYLKYYGIFMTIREFLQITKELTETVIKAFLLQT